MQANQYRERKLNDIEQAFAIANEQYPFCVVSVLHLQHAPDAEHWQKAIYSLQSRHLLLRSTLKKSNGHYSFQEQENTKAITLTAHARPNEESWRPVAEQLLNSQFAAGEPLLKVALIKNSESDIGELILCFHHAIVDGYYARLLLHEILCLASGLHLPDSKHQNFIPVKLPTQTRGDGISRFLLRQFGAEWRYWKKGNRAPIAANSNNASLSLNLTLEQSNKLMEAASKLGISLNSLFLAAISGAVLQRKFANDVKPLCRVISFADLRTNIITEGSNDYPGCLITMLRSDIHSTLPFELTSVARTLQRSLTRCGLQGEPIHMFQLSKTLMKMAIKFKMQRLGISALSFLGNLPLDQHYGIITLQHVTAFVTNNQLGPHLSAFGKILHGKISLDFTYLTAETTHNEACEMVEHVRQMLDSFAKEAYI